MCFKVILALSCPFIVLGIIGGQHAQHYPFFVLVPRGWDYQIRKLTKWTYQIYIPIDKLTINMLSFNRFFCSLVSRTIKFRDFLILRNLASDTVLSFANCRIFGSENLPAKKSYSKNIPQHIYLMPICWTRHSRR